MEKLVKLTAILFVFTVVLCIFCYSSEDYVAKTQTSPSASTMFENIVKTKNSKEEKVSEKPETEENLSSENEEVA